MDEPPLEIEEANPPEDPDVSIVIPIYNEEENISLLLEELHSALKPAGRSYELIMIDDGSRDRSYALLEQAAKTDPSITLIRFRRNFGQTAAIQAGLDAARGRDVVTMDADLQNDPQDMSRRTGAPAQPGPPRHDRPLQRTPSGRRCRRWD